tara:strand:+ start:2840 stop:4006 length:1167 start_codon:yes stop_codon:yes gene_type:complete
MQKFDSDLIVKSISKVCKRKKIYLHSPAFFGNEIKYLSRSIKSNLVSSYGKYTDQFENKLKKFVQSKHVIAVISGTEALHISLRAIGVGDGDEVLVPALTFIGSVNAISYTGANPHFIDSSLIDFGINPKKLENYLQKKTIFKNNKLINKDTKKYIKAIMIVHILGHPCKIYEIIKIAKKYNLKIIEDAAEGIGSYYKKRHLGTFGDIGCLSFNGNKTITTGGGGAIITNNKKYAKTVRHLSSTAKINHKWEFLHNQIGYNYRMPSLNASLGLAQIQSIRKILKMKRKIFLNYELEFKNNYGIKIVSEPKYARSNFWLNAIVIDKKYKNFRDLILKKAHHRKIYLRPMWKLISDLKIYKNFEKDDLSGSKDIYSRTICLPSGNELFLL